MFIDHSHLPGGGGGGEARRGRPGAAWAMPMAAVCIPFAFLHGGILLFDLKNPKLEWNNEMEVVKNNMRTLIPVGVSMGNLILIALAGFLLHMSIPVMTAVFGLTYTALTVLLYLYIRKKDILLADHIS